MRRKRPLLKWKLEDYERYGIEPPESLQTNPANTEGELMSKDDISLWITDSHKTLFVLKEEDENDLFIEVKRCFLEDLEYLYKINKIINTEIQWILKDELFKDL